MTITDFFEYLTGQVDHQPWRERAACKGLDPALFVMKRGDNGGPAKAVCRECEVRSECLDYALTHNEKLGIWGMTSERERKVMRRLGNGVVVQMWLPGDKKQIELRRDWAEVDGSGPWIIQYGATQVTVGGFRNRLAIFGGHPPRPKQKHIDKAVGKALRLDAEAQDTARDPSIEHANLVVEARKELEQ